MKKIGLSRPAILPMPSASSQCSIATSPERARRHGGPPPMAAMLAALSLCRQSPRRRRCRFHKKSGTAITEMVKSRWVYRRLRNFRAGIEAAISCFKRAYGAARCTWRGLGHFKAYIWSAVVAHNLVLFARLKPA
jgi:IS5 family transposase